MRQIPKPRSAPRHKNQPTLVHCELLKMTGTGCLKILVTFDSIPKPVHDAHPVDLMWVNQYFKC